MCVSTKPYEPPRSCVQDASSRRDKFIGTGHVRPFEQACTVCTCSYSHPHTRSWLRSYHHVDLRAATTSGRKDWKSAPSPSARIAATAVGAGLTVAPAFGAAAGLSVVGLGVTLLGVIGESVYDSYKDAHQYEGASRVFLKGALRRCRGTRAERAGRSRIRCSRRRADAVPRQIRAVQAHDGRPAAGATGSIV
jgi:hypothetical protein